jgi:hypothetical protein
MNSAHFVLCGACERLQFGRNWGRGRRLLLFRGPWASAHPPLRARARSRQRSPVCRPGAHRRRIGDALAHAVHGWMGAPRQWQPMHHGSRGTERTRRGLPRQCVHVRAGRWRLPVRAERRGESRESRRASSCHCSSRNTAIKLHHQHQPPIELSTGWAPRIARRCSRARAWASACRRTLSCPSSAPSWMIAQQLQHKCTAQSFHAEPPMPS